MRSSYIREVEKYFLSMVGKGIMLSARDYNIIAGWKKRGVPQEVVLKGISNAVGALKKGSSKGEAPSSLANLAPSIEEEIANHWRGRGDNPAAGTVTNDTVKKVATKLAGAIESERRESIRKHYLRARKEIMSLEGAGEGDIFGKLRQIEDEFYEGFFQALSEAEKTAVERKAEGMIAARSRFMTPRARRESIMSFRNEILRRDYKLANISSDE